MKKLLALLLALVMVFSLAACSGGNDAEEPSGNEGEEPSGNEGEGGETPSGETDENGLVSWKLGMMDPGAWNATSGPLYAQMEAACEALNVELYYVVAQENSAEGHIAAIQNMIGADCDGIILLNGPLVQGIVQQVADMCDEAGVYWSLSWTKIEEGDGNYEACMNSEYFVSTTYEDGVHSANWCTNLLGELGCTQLCEIGFAAGNATGDMRDQGVQQGLEEYSMELLAEERDQTLTSTSDGGKTIMDRFITSYPQMDGLVIAGMSQFVLSGVVSSLEENNLQDDIQVTCIDFHEYQTQYLESGVLDGIIGGHVVGTYYSLILMANLMNGTPLTEEKALIEDNFIELASYEDALICVEYGATGDIYIAEETLNMMQKVNPDFTYEDLLAVVDAYSLDDIVTRAEARA